MRKDAREVCVSRREISELKINELTPNSRWFKVTVKVLEMGEERSVFSRRDGFEHRVAEALVGDETGTILFTVWDDDIDKVKEKVGSSVTINNGYVTLFRGSMRLSLGRFGTIEEPEHEVEKVSRTPNMSDKVFEQRRSFRGGRRRRGF